MKNSNMVIKYVILYLLSKPTHEQQSNLQCFFCFFLIIKVFLFVFILAGCDLAFPANKLVSGEHCKIVQDESTGLVWLEDMR